MVGNTCSAVSSDSLINGLPGGGSDLGAKENLRGRSRGRDTSFQDAPNTVQGVSLGKAYVEVVKELFKEEKSDAEMRVVIDNFYKDYGIVVPPGNTVDTEGDKKVNISWSSMASLRSAFYQKFRVCFVIVPLPFLFISKGAITCYI